MSHSRWFLSAREPASTLDAQVFRWGLRLRVKVQLHDQISRQTYIEKIGQCLEQFDWSKTLAKRPNKIVVQMAPALQLNAMLAVVAFGFHVTVHKEKKPRPTQAKHYLRLHYDRPEYEWTDLKKLPNPQTFQFQTVFFHKRLYSSYYDLIRNRFYWTLQKSVFALEVSVLKAQDQLKLVSYNKAFAATNSFEHDVNSEVYAEYLVGPHKQSFIGTVGDLLVKWPNGAPDHVNIYFLSQRQREKHAKQLLSVHMAMELGLGPVVRRVVQALHRTGLRNLQRVWTDHNIKCVTKHLQQDAHLCFRLFMTLPQQVQALFYDSQLRVSDNARTHTAKKQNLVITLAIIAVYPDTATDFDGLNV